MWCWISLKILPITQLGSSSLLSLPSLVCSSSSSSSLSCVVLATGPGNRPAVRVWTRNARQFGFRPVQNTTRWLLAGQTRTHPCQLAGFAGFGYSHQFESLVLHCSFKFMVTFRYGTVNRKIVTLVHHGVFSTYWPPWFAKRAYSCTLPHPGNQRELSVNDCWSCIFSNMSGGW